MMSRIRGTQSAIRQNEIVEEIVDNLRPWKSHKSRVAISQEVKGKLDTLRYYIPSLTEFYDRTKNREHAKKLHRALSTLEGLLKSTPEALAWTLFNPAVITENEDAPLVLPMSFASTDDILSAYGQHYKRFALELNRLRNACAYAIKPGLGAHPNHDHAKHSAAWFALDIIRHLSQREATGTEDGPFRTISSLLYEAVSGQEGADLKRACDAVLQAKTCDLPAASSENQTSA